jgi:uncharacterized Zn-binding protein involved in type VI secretion
MSIVGFIVMGDRTSHGGVVVSGDMTFTIDGQPAARVGDKVFCTRCNKMTVIITSRFPSIFDLGQTMAYDQDSTSCGALLQSRHNGHAGWDCEETDSNDGHALESALAVAPVAECLTKKALRFREHFVLHDDEGTLAANVPYSVTTAEGNTYEGETDAEGRTGVVWTDSPDAIDITVLSKPSEGDDPYHQDEQASGDF